MNIMISYSRLDTQEVEAILAVLKQLGISVWRDTTHIGPGADWREILLKKPTAADAFIPFLSEN